MPEIRLFFVSFVRFCATLSQKLFHVKHSLAIAPLSAAGPTHLIKLFHVKHYKSAAAIDRCAFSILANNRPCRYISAAVSALYLLLTSHRTAVATLPPL